jgi:UDP-N-acetylmuramoyl-tripeptide--D-alanyl-D-alanine ligase
MLRLQDVLAGAGGTLHGAPPDRPGVDEVAFRGVGLDSRTIAPGELFVAVRGESHDGHRFVPDAVARGATGALVARGRAAPLAALPTIAGLDPAPVLIEVDDTLAALGALAAYWRRKFADGLQVVGITGSVGKSSTKELTAAVLGRRLRVLKSPKSFNNEFGLPLSVLLLGPATDVAVLEMGTHGPGQIRELCAIARPTIGVVTNVGDSHLERMGSREAIAAAKAELVEALPASGAAILNGDDPLVRAMAPRTRARVITYGQGEGCDLRATDIRSHGFDGLTFTLRHADAARTLERAPLLGAHSVYTALAAAATGLAAGLSLDDVARGLRDPHTPVRLMVVPGRDGSTIVDDSYNASPASALAALAILADAPAARRIAVLGDMLELGAYEEEGHRLVGRRAATVADRLLTIGPRARLIAEAAERAGLPPGAIARLERKDEAATLLERDLRRGDVVLIKGSRGLALEDLVAALRATS